MRFIFKEWEELWTPPFKKREIDLSLIFGKVRKIVTFTGCRRTGKTYLMFQLINKLEEKNPRKSIFYVNFEDERIDKTEKNLSKLIPLLLEMYGERDKYFLFLDELHLMPNWASWLRRVYDTYRNFMFFASGSSSKLSTKEIPSSLRGRTINIEVFPLNFNEFLRFNGVTLEKNWEYSERALSLVKRMLAEYLEFGGFPEIVLEDNLRRKKKFIDDYFRTIVTSDIAYRYEVKKTSNLTDFLKLLLNSVYFSVSKSYNFLRSQGRKIGKQSLIDYTKYAEEVYFSFFLPIFSPKIKDLLRYPKKVYFVDNSFINFVGIKFSRDYGRLMENMVFVELRREKNKNPLLEIYYFKSNDKEVDFVVKEGLRVKQLIQVTYASGRDEIERREIKSLLKASETLKCKNLFVITWDYEGEEEIKGKKIKFLPLWKWLLVYCSIV
jgi:hypothetical protein